MNGPFQVAQATGTANSSSSAPPRIYKLTKPLTDQAVVVNLGYDQKVQVDFSAIANEKITLVHVGEKLIILFDNQSTVTVEPFFDSRHDALQNITIEMAPGRDVSVSEFASLFPITTDSSVLPAADNGGASNANAQASGANFSPSAVDPLPPVPSNTLAPQEDLPTFTTEPQTGFVPTPPIPVAPTIVAGLVPGLVVDESFLTVATNGIAGSGQGPVGSTVATGLVPFTIDAPAGQQSLTFALSISGSGVDSGLIDSQTGNHVFLFLENGQVVGREGANSGAAAGGPADFTLAVDATGHITLADLRSVHEGVGETGDVNEGVSLPAGLVTLTATVTDNSNQSASASVDIGPHLTILDDGPSVSIVVQGEPALAVDESFLTAATNGIDGTTPNLANTHTTGDFSGAFTSVQGADGASIAYSLGVSSPNVDSGLIDSATGDHIFLVLNGNTVEGHVGATATLAFTLALDPATGVVTLTDLRAVHEGVGENGDISEGVSLNSIANLVTLTATITDKDGDTATASIDLGKQVTFNDDGPTIEVRVLGEEQHLPFLAVDESFLTAATNGIDGSTPNLANTHTTGDFSTAFTSVPGADGATFAYALGITGGDGTSSGLVDSQTGQTDVLVLNGNTIEGHVGTTGGALAFTIAVDPATGIVTLTEDRSVMEAFASSPDTSEGISLNSVGNLVTLTATITDADGDHQSATIDLGKQLSFHDDGPSVTAVASAVQDVLDESGPSGTATINLGGIVQGNDPDVAGSGYISHAVSTGSLVTPTIAFGADGPAASGNTVYALTVDNATSGLFLTDGSAINLQLVNGVVVGVVASGAFSGQAAFAISIDSATGVTTVEQYLSLHQDSASNTPDDSVHLNANSLGINVTVTDGDSDQASAHTDVSAQIIFHDDGPSVTAVASAVQDVLDESGPSGTATINLGGIVQGNDPDVAGSGYISHAVSTGSLVTPTIAFGADGPAASGNTVYALTVDNATSGLFLTDGSAINLQLVNGVVVGVVASGAFSGQAAFAISIDSATGVTTVEQYLSLHQDSASNTPDDSVHLNASSLGINVTVTDGDSDQASAHTDVSAQIIFHDDGPSVTAVASAVQDVLDESGPSGTATINLGGIVQGNDPDVAGSGYISHAVSTGSLVTPTIAFGADGPAASGNTVYALTVDNATSGLFLTDGSAINLQLVNGVVVGVVASGAFSGQAAFAISIDSATGVTTVEQYLSLHQDSASNTPDDSVHLNANSLGINVTVTDGDSDQASAHTDVSAQIIFHDDGPSVTAVASAVQDVLDESGPSGTATINLGGIVQGNDPDVAGSGYISHAVSTGSLVTPTIAFGADGPAASGNTVYALTVDNATSGLFLTDGSAINLQLVNGVVVGVVASGAFSGQAAFAISIDSATGVTTVEQYLSLHQDSASNTPDDSVHLNANSLGINVTVTDGDSDQASAHTDVSAQIIFHDDGPSVTAVASAVQDVLDESGPSGTATINLGGIVQGNDPDVAGSGYISHAVSTGSLVTPTIAFGADGPAASGNTVYALTVDNATSGLFLTDGSAINLQLVNGVVVGVVASGAFSGQAAFAISIDSATGVTTVEQYLSLHQDSASNTPDDSVHLNANSLGINVTVTDGDSDQASAHTDVSAQIIFHDDGPSVTAVASAVQDVLDESGPSGTATINLGGIVQGNDPDVAGSGYISHAVSTGSLVTPTIAFGADGPAASGNTVYALTVDNATSGLFLTDGSAINLQLVNGVVVGVVASGAFSGQAAFAISIDSATGVTTVEQYLSLHQDSASNTPDDSVHLNANSLGINVTVTDGDSDQASAHTDVSAQIIFHDDGPSVTAVASAVQDVLDESGPSGTATINLGGIVQGNDPDVAGSGYISHAVSTGSLVTPTIAFGADGPAASGNTVYALTVDNATSGLFLTDGSAINLQLVNGVVVGVVASGAFSGQAAFAISIDSATGVTTVEQYLSLHQDSASNTPDDSVHLNANSLGINVTVTDGDSDQASAHTDVSAQIIFHDDGPSVTAVASAVQDVLDESGPSGTATINLGGIVQGNDPDVAGSGYISHAVSTGSLVTPTIAFGADGPAASGNTVYALTVDNATSGLFLTDGSAINLQLVNGVVVGVVASGAFSGQAAFAISIDSATGVTTVEQYLSLHQDSASNTPDDSVHLNASSLGINVTVTDGDSDQASAHTDVSAQIIFHDDGPSVTAVASAVQDVLDESGPSGTATINLGGIVQGNDPDVAGSGYISHAVSTGSLVTPTIAFGADGPAASGNTVYALTVDNATSGLFLTDGSAINLQLVNGVVVGVVASGAFSGQAAFAISIDSATGVTTVEQYLSLHQDSASNTPDDSVHLNANSLGINVTVTDGDSDQASAHTDVSAQIIFHDDGPSVTAVASAVQDVLDESGPSGTATINLGGIVQGNDPDVAGSGYISHAVSTGSLVTPTIAFGADGPAASGNTVYALTVDNATSGLFLTDGSAINLQLVNGVVVGVVASGAFSGQAAFAISIDSATGVTTVEQYLSLHQDSASNTPDDSVHLNASSLGINVTVTDGDSDQASAHTDVSAQIIFHDDGPSVTAVASAVQDVLDESGPSGTATINLGGIVQGNDPDVAGSGYISHAVSTGSLVTPTIAFGADGPAASGNTVYALTVDNATSGLFLTDGSAINLQLVNGVVVGVVASGAFSGQAAFAISIDSATGVTTVEQYLSLHQDSASNTPDDSVHLNANSLGINVTVTDGDSDQASAHTDVSAQIIFHDDGPSVTAVASAVQDVLDESGPSGTATINLGGIVQGNDPDVAGSGYISHAVSTGSLVTPTIAFGADGPAASGNTVYALTVDNATSGLFLTDGSAINLQLVNGVVVGVVASGAFSGQAAFAISIDSATGVTTVEQYLSLHQDSASNTPDDSVHLNANSLGINVTVTDGDSDQASAHTDVSAQIIFHDDGPSVTAVASAVQDVLDESGPSGTATINLGGIVQGNDPDVAGSGYISHAVSTGSLVTPTIAFGADGPAASGNTVYALTVDNATSGLFLTDGSAINLQLVNGVVVGVVASGAFSGQAAFAISIDSATGVTTVEQYLSLHQDSASNTPDDSVHLNANSLGINVTVTDGDSDQASAHTDVSAQIIFHDDGPSVGAVQDAIMPNVSNTDVHGTWQPVFGADGLSATAAISIAMGTAPSGLTYTVTDTGTAHNGDEVFSVLVSNGTSSYTFYEYSDYNAATHTGDMFAFTNAALSTPFFELGVAANGTYDFHLDTNTLLSNTSVNLLTAVHNGNGSFVTINGTTAAYGSGNDPSSGFDLLIDGWNNLDTNPNDHKVFKDNNGLGIDNSNLETNETIMFKYGTTQSAITVSVGKATTTSEHFHITIWDPTHTTSVSEDVTLPDGTIIQVDAAHWGTGGVGGTGTTTGAFMNFGEVDITNVGIGANEDQSVVLTGLTFNEQTVIGSTQLNFALGITDGDGDSAVSASNLDISLLGTFSSITGTSASEVIAASATTAMIITGGGGVDTADFSNDTTTAVVASLASGSATGSWVGTDTLSGITGLIGSAHGGDTLTAANSGSTLVAFGPNDTLNGGTGNDTLIANHGNETMNGGGGSDSFVLTPSGASADGKNLITEDFTDLADAIFVDVGDRNLTINTASSISASQFQTQSNVATNSSWNMQADSFMLDSGTHDLWYSANGTGADKIDLAHMATGVPAAAQIHVL
ncbi:DUF5801 repeats-in-toxin domain-containing protein [Bradyrhizobium sp. AZCC 2289]|uniref:DUF5801 repeats-in-toxin domain-containing protein n=1 Tax=Bradyrhizobium sp. AZCC 2289 TaxID=3117026 RepID=UPI002FEF3629